MNIDRSSTALENRSAQHERHVGVVLSVRGSQASVGLLQRSGEFPSLESATVGNCLAIVSKRSILIGFITQVSVKIPEIVAHKGYSGSARLDLMGEIRTEAGGSRRFLRGITQYPHVGDPVIAIGSNELRVVYGKQGDATISIGHCNRTKLYRPIFTSTRC